MTASGKIQKFVLRDMAKAKLNRESSFVFKDENE